MTIRERLRVEATDESHRVTSLELFFDLVFVYALTQVTTLMAARPSAAGVAPGPTPTLRRPTARQRRAP